MEPATKTSTSQVRIQPHEAAEVWAAVGRLTDNRDLDTLTPDEFVDLANELTPHLPADVRRRVVEYRRYAPDGDVVLMRGLLPEDVTFPRTAAAPWAPATGTAQGAALLLTSVTVMLGEPFNYASLYDGRLVQNMVPVRGMEFTQTSQSSVGMLDWHCEDSFRDDRCDYAGLLCLRGDGSAASRYAQAKDVRLAPETVAVLREPRFHVRPDPAHVLPGQTPLRRLPILSGSKSAPEIAYDMHHLAPIDDADAEAAGALRDLAECLNKVAISHVMERGDLLIFDNKRVVHARTPFDARFDGTDRWLMRTMICGSALTFRRWGQRIPV
ncbi:L-asparagine oxygenase [Pilimelia terevasa]|uniref:L-asparagine oxygenase n=1 Tax=Pilimelia terevasa TaxID=53372 RepID=A0A8J3FJW0_9ACTN|nr:TauD/TfdA family dioxygenase [Pilimelia terevasa]GGK43409.1 L-asparagine oxygenase [Pilimelia terevasa]